ncbi:MAG: TPM domain-containing protein [Lachnospiraceae bacterium]|jgi:uncharacterized protein|nr:TPM domain-containing protein [Lachnospiraceae bacterium]
MKRKRTRLTALLLLISIAAALLLCGYDKEDTKVFDQAGLLTKEEEEALQEDIVKAAKKLSLDVVIVTTDDAGGKSAKEYADDFFDENHFGYEKDDGSGILLLIDMDNREIWISTAGTAMETYTDRDVSNMVNNEVLPYMKQGDYYGACRKFIDAAVEYGTNSETANNGYYDEEKDTFVEYTSPEERKEREKQLARERLFSAGGILGRLGISLIIGAVGVVIMLLNVRSKRAPGGRVYMKPGSEYIRDRYDRLVNTTVTTRRIEREHSSGRSGGGGGHTSTHTSSSGRSHGGGGGKF